MKLTFIISSLSSGGAERVLTNLANQLVNEFEVSILMFSTEEPFYELDKRVKLVKLDLLKNSRNPIESILNSLKRVFVLTKHMKKEKADVYISFMTHTNLLSILAAKLSGKKIIISERTIYDFYPSKLLYKARRLFYPLANHVVVLTEGDKKNYPWLKNISVIPISVTTAQNVDLTNKENIILAVGRLTKQKRFMELIETFVKLNLLNWKLVIAGNGEDRELLVQKIKELNIDNIELIGKRKDIFDWYQKASIFVLSSEKEGFSNVLVEAMSMGCACVAFDCPYGPGEIINHEVDGILVENQNFEMLGKEIKRVCEDEELRKKLGNEAKKVVERFGIDKIVREWRELILKFK